MLADDQSCEDKLVSWTQLVDSQKSSLAWTNFICYCLLLNVYLLTFVSSKIRRENFVKFILVCYSTYLVLSALLLYPLSSKDAKIFNQQLISKLPLLVAHWGYSSQYIKTSLVLPSVLEKAQLLLKSE